MQEQMKRQMNRQMKEQSRQTVDNSKMTAAQKQRQVALDTKAEKEATRQRNAEQRMAEEQRARNMKAMINA